MKSALIPGPKRDGHGRDARESDADEGESGSILPMLIGMLALIALLSGGVVNLSSLYLSHRALYQIADSAALKAVTHLDQNSYYLEGAAADVPTSDEETIVASVIKESELVPITVESLEIGNGSVALTLAHRVSLPSPLLTDSVVIRARAHAVAVTESKQVP